MRRRVRLPKQCAAAHAIGQHVTYGDRSTSGRRIVERALDASQDAAAPELRQPVLDSVVEVEHALVHEDHGGRSRDRLGQGGEANDGVRADRCAVFRGDAYGVLLWLAATADYGDRTGYVARGDEGGRSLMKVREQCAPQALCAHRSRSSRRGPLYRWHGASRAIGSVRRERSLALSEPFVRTEA